MAEKKGGERPYTGRPGSFPGGGNGSGRGGRKTPYGTGPGPGRSAHPQGGREDPNIVQQKIGKLKASGRHEGSAPRRVGSGPQEKKERPKVDALLMRDVADSYIDWVIAQMVSEDRTVHDRYEASYEGAKQTLKEAALASKTVFAGDHKAFLELLSEEGFAAGIEAAASEHVDRLQEWDEYFSQSVNASIQAMIGEGDMLRFVKGKMRDIGDISSPSNETVKAIAGNVRSKLEGVATSHHVMAAGVSEEILPRLLKVISNKGPQQNR